MQKTIFSFISSGKLTIMLTLQHHKKKLCPPKNKKYIQGITIRDKQKKNGWTRFAIRAKKITRYPFENVPFVPKKRAALPGPARLGRSSEI
jgi:hypothetical protein